MSLPLSRNRSYAGTAAVASSDLMDVQSQLAGYWRGRRKIRTLNLSAADAGEGGGSLVSQHWPTFGVGYRAATTSGMELFVPFRLVYGTRIRQLKPSYQNGGGSTMTWSLWRKTSTSTSDLASGSLAGGAGVQQFAALFANPLPKHALKQLAANGVDRDISFVWVLRSAQNLDRFYGLQVEYDHLGVTPV